MNSSIIFIIVSIAAQTYASHQHNVWENDLHISLNNRDWENISALTKGVWLTKISPPIKSKIQFLVGLQLNDKKVVADKYFWSFFNACVDQMPDQIKLGGANKINNVHKKSLLLNLVDKSVHDPYALSNLKQNLSAELLLPEDYYRFIKKYASEKGVSIENYPDIKPIIEKIKEKDALLGLIASSFAQSTSGDEYSQVMKLSTEDKKRLKKIYDEDLQSKTLLMETESILSELLLAQIKDQSLQERPKLSVAMELFLKLSAVNARFKCFPVTKENLPIRIQNERKFLEIYAKLIRAYSPAHLKNIKFLIENKYDEKTFLAEVFKLNLDLSQDRACIPKDYWDRFTHDCPWAALAKFFLQQAYSEEHIIQDSKQTSLIESSSPHIFIADLMMIAMNKRKRIQKEITQEKFENVFQKWDKSTPEGCDFEHNIAFWQAWWCELKGKYSEALQYLKKVESDHIYIKTVQKKLEFREKLASGRQSDHNIIPASKLLTEIILLKKETSLKYQTSLGISRFWCVHALDILDSLIKVYAGLSNDTMITKFSFIVSEIEHNVLLANIKSISHEFINAYYLDQLGYNLLLLASGLFEFVQEQPFISVQEPWNCLEEGIRLMCELENDVNLDPGIAVLGCQTYCGVIGRYVQSGCKKSLLGINYDDRHKLLLKGLECIDVIKQKNIQKNISSGTNPKKIKRSMDASATLESIQAIYEQEMKFLGNIVIQ